MTVLIGNDVPPAIRGQLKRWFIEPKPNVFVGTLSTRTEEKVLAFVLKHVSKDFGLLIVTSATNCQGYTLRRLGPEGKSGRKKISLSGIPLIAEQWISPDQVPF